MGFKSAIANNALEIARLLVKISLLNSEIKNLKRAKAQLSGDSVTRSGYKDYYKFALESAAG